MGQSQSRHARCHPHVTERDERFPIQKETVSPSPPAVVSSETSSAVVQPAKAVTHVTDHPRLRPAVKCTKFPLMRLPWDLILYISQHSMDPPSALAFSLTCKAMWAATFTKSLARLQDDFDREDFFLLLERDLVGLKRPIYYCHRCIRLHTFDLDRDGPNTVNPYLPYMHPYLPYPRRGIPPEGCCRKVRLSIDRDDRTIGYPHARLIMNEHLYGAGHGLPLSTLKIIYRGDPERHWTLKWLAKVIDDELYLSVTHTLRFRGTAMELAHILGKSDHEICAHVGTREHPSYTEQQVRDRLRHAYQLRLSRFAGPEPRNVWFNPKWGDSRSINCFRRQMKWCWLVEECREVSGSCVFCSTDYTTTLEGWKTKGTQDDGRLEWVLRISAYHGLGRCRSLFDLKWNTFLQRVVAYSVPWRELLGPPPGAVKAKWESA